MGKIPLLLLFNPRSSPRAYVYAGQSCVLTEEVYTIYILHSHEMNIFKVYLNCGPSNLAFKISPKNVKNDLGEGGGLKESLEVVGPQNIL